MPQAALHHHEKKHQELSSIAQLLFMPHGRKAIISLIPCPKSF